ncbi:geranylgeranylglycerol-phosphate geranylgeranyltransferase [Flavobacterium sp.]|uniref:geranylgeranylglycerol-phosphate geranylgeranyltransferase n=1 Tax=Flavobacterium sp. TaxID=239 RepID=UPI002C522A8B|nr:geranylgeranylglycerol-phosphate geranylgeranyltransferase [Flavobacterium sp.]HQA75392.1 geranylgeranylglycerol-phosphate geranylgeranyltransferase [Flavobacterium sp.]
MKFLNLIRYKNLLLIALMQLLFRYGFLAQQDVPLVLKDWQYALLVLATVLIAAAGYVINDIMDQETDLTNKPNDVIVGKSISEDTAYYIYFALTISGVLIGYYLSNYVNKTSFFGIFIIISVLLYLYATSFKQIAVVGNLIVAFVLGLSVVIIGMFDIIPLLSFVSADQSINLQTLLGIILDYAIFAFFINFNREIVKDLEDIDGDYNQGMNTLPIAIGKERTAKIVSVFAAIATLVLLWYVNKNLMDSKLFWASAYCLLLVISPMLFITVKSWTAKSKKEFRLLSSVLKMIIFFGILSVLIISLNIKYNVKG